MKKTAKKNISYEIYSTENLLFYETLSHHLGSPQDPLRCNTEKEKKQILKLFLT